MKRRKNGSRWITKDRRLAIYIRDNFTCMYCLRNLKGTHPNNINLDHLEVKLGGKIKVTSEGYSIHNERNLVTTCFACNNAKRDTDYREYAPDAVNRIDIQRTLLLNLVLARALINGDAPEHEYCLWW